MFVANLDGDVTGVPLCELISSDCGRCFGSLAFSRLQAVELQALVIGDETGALTNIELKAGHWPCLHGVERLLTSAPAGRFQKRDCLEWWGSRVTHP